MLAIGGDHAAFSFKEEIKEYLDEKGIAYKDFGCHSPESTHYPIYGEKVARAVASGEYDRGILICGTGVGISLAANKVKGIRAVVCTDCYTAALSKRHNNTNILALGARVVGIDLAKMIIDTWLEAEFEGGRHQKRVDMIMAIEEKNS
ncbi:MAG: ribose 5-phosphate isomerase B [Clostridiales bacterium]|nr:ribose 5-phosphate isomerase B [Clostridiales bacterium]